MTVRDELIEFVADWVNETAPPNKFRGLDGNVYDFPYAEAVELAHSGHEPFFRLNRNQAWGVRWYALNRVGNHYVLTVGFGLNHRNREVPAHWVPDILYRYFTRNEITEAGKALLK